MMSYLGRVRDGTVVLDEGAGMPEGVPVKIDLLDEPTDATLGQSATTLAERYKDMIGIVSGLPPDMARNHDHYLYGAPKK